MTVWVHRVMNISGKDTSISASQIKRCALTSVIVGINAKRHEEKTRCLLINIKSTHIKVTRIIY